MAPGIVDVTTVATIATGVPFQVEHHAGWPDVYHSRVDSSVNELMVVEDFR